MERVTILGDEKELLGDIFAPVGSREWAIAARYKLQKLLDNCKNQPEYIEGVTEAFIASGGYKHLTDRYGIPFRSYDAFCLERRPNGLQRPRAEIEALIAMGKKKTAREMAADPEVKPVAKQGDSIQKIERAENGTLKGDSAASVSLQTVVDIVNYGGNSSSYLVRRLKRDAPDIAAALARGEYKSARAAAIAAGIVKVPTPIEQIKKLYGKLSDDEKAAFVAWLTERLETLQS